MPNVCFRVGCPELTDGTWCRAHEPQRRRPVTAHNRLVREVLAVSPWCVGCGDRATQVDHVIPLEHGGSTTPDNLQPLCRDCHETKNRAYTRKLG